MIRRTLNLQRTAWISILLISTASVPGQEDRFAQLHRQLEGGKTDPQTLNEWSELALDSNKFEEWCVLMGKINRRQISSELLTPSARLLLTWELDSNQWMSLSKLAHTSGIDKFQWRLAGYIRTKFLSNESRTGALSPSHPSLEELKPDFKETAPLVLMLFGSFILLTLCAVALARRLLRNRVRLQPDLPMPEIIAQLKELLQDGSQPRRYQIALSELKLSLFQKSIEDTFKSKSLWDQLSERQRLFLYLIIQGHAAKECADYFDVSLGHWYNQRSELRSLCGLDEGESFEQLFDSPRESGA